MNCQYQDYLSTEKISISKSKLYTDNYGFPNDIAFNDFCKSLTGNEGLIMVCLIFDVTVSNNKDYQVGTEVLKKLYNQLKDSFYIFRYSGNKFNILSKANNLSRLKTMCDTCPAKYATIYYGIVDECIVTSENYEEQCRIGVERMYKQKSAKASKTKLPISITEKQSIPAEYQENQTHKSIQTMWYGIIKFEEKEPLPHTLTALIYPTEYKDYPAPLNMVVVLDDKVNSRIFWGTNVTIGFDGNRFDINCRINAEGNLIIQCFPDRDNKGVIDLTIKRHEGIYLPAEFGKQIDNNREIFPVKPNSYGSYDYVVWDKIEQKAEYNSTGIVSSDNHIYTVTFNNKGIELTEFLKN